MDDIKLPPRPPYKPLSPALKLDQIRDIAEASLPSTSLSNPVEPIPAVAETLPSDIDLKIDNSPKSNFKVLISPKRLSIKTVLIILGIVAALLFIGFGAYWFFLRPNKPKTNSTPIVVAETNKPTPKPKVVSPLTGVELSDASQASRPVTGLMIENSPEARPQSGLNEAGIVFEAVAEGGITRFLALFQETRPQYIGPVRSARPYYIDFALPFDAGYGHVGGSPDALNDIKALGVKDLDQFYNAGAYDRISERYAPHNVYTGFDKLDALNKSKGYNSSKFTPFDRKKDVPQTPTALTIDFSISSSLYSPRFTYDAATNGYKRSQAGEPHIDLKSKVQISPKVVIALVMEKGLQADGSHTTYKDIGSGKMYVFQDGIVSEGTWAKADRKGQFTFTDKNGLSIKLNAGQTWFSIVGSDSDVTYKI